MRVTLITGTAILCFTCLISTACNSAPPSNAKSQTSSTVAEKKEPVLFTGRNCLSQIANAAARWQPDAMPVHLESSVNAESSGQNGKATVWRATFASPTRGVWRSFTCSGSRLNDEAPIGVTGSLELPSSADTSRAMFQSLLLMVDSDKAFATAQENGGAGILKKNPQQPVLYALDWDAKNKELVWAVMYGSSRSDSKGIGVIDATSGKFLRAAK
jgi:hypothetical protein